MLENVIIIELNTLCPSESLMRSQSPKGWGPVEYVLLVILIFLVIFTILSLFWPAIQLFYNANLK